jgi:hypothetical protein
MRICGSPFVRSIHLSLISDLESFHTRESEVNDLPNFRPHWTFLAMICDLDICHQRLLAACGNGVCSLHFFIL